MARPSMRGAHLERGKEGRPTRVGLWRGVRAQMRSLGLREDNPYSKNGTLGRLRI